jgi:ribosome-binding factor A
MPKEFDRSKRVQALLQRQLADVIRSQVKDPRVGVVTITDVQVSRDLSRAKVFVSDLDAESVQQSVEALNNAAGFVRRVLKERISMRTIPELQFIHDESIERGARLYSLIQETTEADAERENDETPDTASTGRDGE